MNDCPYRYLPQAGTMAYSCLMALADNHGQKLPTPALLAAIGQPEDYKGLSGILAACIEHGLIDKTKIEGTYNVQWFTTDVGAMAALWLTQQNEPTTRLQPASEQAAEPFTEVGDEVEPIDPPADCEFALTSTGRLLIEVKGQKFALDKEYADALFAHTDYARGVGPIGGEA
jgi:hypothetical protein